MEFASNQEREIRAARNQAMFRAVNEKISELNDQGFQVDRLRARRPGNETKPTPSNQEER